MNKLKPFDLEAAKRGEPIITRDGEKVYFIAHVPELSESYRVVTRIEGEASPYCVSESGRYFSRETETPFDLFMAPRKRTMYVNIYEFPLASRDSPGNCAAAYYTEDSARNNRAPVLAVAVPVEIEI